MDAKTAELREAHDVLAEFYADRLAGVLEQMPIERAVLGLFCELVRGDQSDNEPADNEPDGNGSAGDTLRVGDIGCGTGRLAPFLTGHGLTPHGVDLSAEMIRVARRDQPGFACEVGDVRELPFATASLAGAVCWYSLMYLAPDDVPRGFAELARVVRPGGYLATAFKAGDDTLRRGGRTLNLGIEFDIYWRSPEEVQRQLVDAGFQIVFWAGRPGGPDEPQPQGYVIAQRQ